MVCAEREAEAALRSFYRVNQGGFIRAGKSTDNNVRVRQNPALYSTLGGEHSAEVASYVLVHCIAVPCLFVTWVQTIGGHHCAEVAWYV